EIPRLACGIRLAEVAAFSRVVVARVLAPPHVRARLHPHALDRATLRVRQLPRHAVPPWPDRLTELPFCEPACLGEAPRCGLDVFDDRDPSLAMVVLNLGHVPSPVTHAGNDRHAVSSAECIGLTLPGVVRCARCSWRPSHLADGVRSALVRRD